jgi:hypothetical protein
MLRQGANQSSAEFGPEQTRYRTLGGFSYSDRPDADDSAAGRSSALIDRPGRVHKAGCHYTVTRCWH